MLYFNQIRTARFTFTLQEISINAARRQLNMPEHLREKTRSFFLKNALKELVWHKPYEDNTPDHLTAQERLFIEACYIAGVSDTPDFVMANGRYSDFLQIEHQFKPQYLSIELGAIPGDDDVWFFRPLTGLMLEVIEERVNNMDSPARLDWIFLAMSAQLSRKTENIPDLYADAVAYGDWLEKRAETMATLPESRFLHLMALYFKGANDSLHLFDINFDDQGVLIYPKKEVGDCLPARFRVSAAVTELTQKLVR